jgi:hypothetical protein
VDIIADDRVVEAAEARRRLAEGRPVSEEPAAARPDDAWCSLCGQVADLSEALVIENRAILCGVCVSSVASAAAQAKKPEGPAE